MTARNALLVAVALSAPACKSDHGAGAGIDGPGSDGPRADAVVSGPALTFNWISGATLTKPCSSAVIAGDTIWTCGFTNAGTTYEAIWDTSVPCDAATSTCPTKDFAVDAVWTSYQDITGASHAITGDSVPIGKKVIVLAR